jgi:hypothetical protein
MEILFSCKGYGRMSDLLIYIMFSRKLGEVLLQIPVNLMDNDG